MRANLASAGLPVKIVQLDDPFGASIRPGAEYDMLLTAWFYDWADPSEGLNLLLDPKGFRPNWAGPALESRTPTVARSSTPRSSVGPRVPPPTVSWA